MFKRGVIFVGSLILLSFLIISCTAPPTPTTSTTAAPKVVSTAPETWQQEWDDLINAARKEGMVGIVTAVGPDVRQALAQGFKDKFGIDIEFIVGRGAENLTKIRAQRQAELYLMDVHIDGTTPQFQFKEAGFLESVEPLLLLPEVLDSKAWFGGGINFLGKDKYALTFACRPTITVAINSEMVKPEEIKSYLDLLHPRFKGKIVLQDPSVGGGGNLVITVLTWDIMGEDFLDKLIMQEPVITRDNRLMTDWVAKGRYPVMVPPDSTILTEFVRAGAPLKAVWPIEGTSLSAGFGALSLLNRAPHPAAAKVFINWLLTREGQITMMRAWGSQSGRLDIIPDWIEPEWRLQPGYKYARADTEESLLKQMKMMELAKVKFGHLMK